MSKHDKQQALTAKIEFAPAPPAAVKLNYGEWLTLRKHATFQPILVTSKGSMIPTLMAKGFVDPKDLKITPLGERALAEFHQ